jgi:serine/threonine protein kinase/tetratricopeptide (TPR) repeat protein
MQCTVCQAENPPTAVSCTKCSTPLPWNDASLGTTLPGGTLPPGAVPSSADAWSIAVTSPSDVPGVAGEPLVGTLLAERYEILEMLGQGGMGAVYKARDTELERLVALKLIRPELASNPEMLRRFKQELILAREVTHRNVIRIFDLGQARGLKFITMEFVEGRDLRAVLRERKKIPVDETVQMIAQVCRALESAHAAGVVHRDLKPQNIMLDRKDRVYVMDFGIAHSLETPGMTQTGALMGTPEYMSPEQAKGMKVDARSDLFSLGIIFYEMLTGISPYQADTAIATLLKRTQERPQPPADVDPAIPRAISDVVMKCLEINRDDRYSSAREILEDLGQEMPTSARTIAPTLLPSPAASPSPQSHREEPKATLVPWKWIAASLALAIAVGGAYVLRGRLSRAPATSHAPVTVLIADFNNHTGDSVFTGTLESTLKLALEGASFISAYNRTRMRDLGIQPVALLDDAKAQEIAANQGLNVVISGSLDQQGSAYRLSLRAVQVITGKTIATAEEIASNKDQILFAVTKLGTAVRRALGDPTSETDQLFAMDTVSAASIEAVHGYSLGLQALGSGRNEEAQKDFSQTVDLDPNFGLAYVGLAVSAHGLGRQQDAEKYIKQAITHIDRMTERERFRTRGYLYLSTGDSQKCVDEYGALLSRYPSDSVADNNLADCFMYLRNISRAVEEVRKAVNILPKLAVYHVNLALYSAYGGDFKTAAAEATATEQLNPSYVYGYLAEAFADLGSEQIARAGEVYQKITNINSSLGATGSADLALYQGRFKEAADLLQKGAAADSTGHNPDGAADKLAELGYTQLLRGDKPAALAAAKSALDLSKEVKTRFIAARIFAATDDVAKATEIAQGLSNELQVEPQAYAKLIEGEIAIKKGDGRGAVKLFTDANSLLDTWIGRFDLGRAYLEIGAFTEADSEFDRCITRRGETLALFLDEVPSYGYFPQVYYYQGRVREGLKSQGFKESYKKYLDIRGSAGEDPLLAEIRRRAGT